MAQVIPPPPLIPQRRPRNEPEVIDVDLLDDDEIIITGYGRSQRRRLSHGPPEFTRTTATRSHNPEIIVLSDDEAEGSGSHLRTTGPRRRLVSPPPPPRQVHRPPPVPPFPLRVLFPRRSHSRAPQPPPPPPAIIPNPDPFDFEANLQPPPHRQSTPPPVLPPRGAPVSHHQPVMGLGGAILALNRPARLSGVASGQRQQGARDTEVHRHSRLLGLPDVSSWVADLFGIRRRPEPRTRAAYDFWPLADLDLDHYQDGMPSMDEMLAQARQPKSTEVMWKAEYTHNGSPQPGYTYHFTEELPPVSNHVKHETGSSSAEAIMIQDDEHDNASAGPSRAGPSKMKSESGSGAVVDTGFTLICTRCMDPLVLPDDNDEAVSAEERKARRVWGLRCGHILDGKCIQNIMRPPLPTVVADANGKGKIVQAVPSAPTKGRRGKGKTKTNPGLEQGAVKEEFADVPAENSMRSRLRPRHPRANDAATVSSALTLGDNASEGLVASAMSPSRRREARDSRASHPYAKAKGRGRARKLVVLEEYEWQCPVAGCAHVHRSRHLKGQDEAVDGGWSMDPEKGAIAMFL